jgi:hypothetical protein
MSESRIPLGDSFDPRLIRDEQWNFRGLSSGGDYYVWTYTDPVLDITIEKKQPVEADALLRQNAERYKESEGKRWGDGKVVASIPLNKFYQDFKGRHDDPDFTSWWLNNDENSPFRTFRGKI